MVSQQAVEYDISLSRKTCTCLQRLEGQKRAGEQKPSERSEEQNQTVSREVSKDGSDSG